MADFKTKSCEHEASSSEHNTSECSNEDMTSLIGDVISEKMIQEEKLLEKEAIEAENELQKQIKAEEKLMEEEQCYKRLNLLLSRSSIYAKFMAEKLERDKLKEAKKQLRAEKQPEFTKTQGKKRKKALVNISNKKSFHTVVSAFKNGSNQNDESKELCNSVLSDNKREGHPSLLTGAVLHPYQIDGFEWLKVLFENGVNGILADEMGLGKTIQTIAFIAYLIEMGISGPFFVCGPLSTVPNWHSEFRRFTPSIPVMVYHGHREERRVMRNKFLKKVKVEDVSCYPVIITSYQIALIDSKFLSKYEWTLLVLDEAQRIKNFQCKLVVALKSFSTSHRLLLTGTPLQNNLAELWSLLNFILPEIFDDLKVFESWFDITRLAEKGGTDEIVAKEQEKQIVSIIHQILAPFLLRRTKAEIQLRLPPKKELIVHAPLTKLQKEYYMAVLNKTIEKVVCNNSRGTYFDVKIMDRNSRIKPVNFDHIYKALESKEFEAVPATDKNLCVAVNSKPESDDIFADLNLNIRNSCVLLRKVCGHPYLLSFPLDWRTGGYKIDEDLISKSGKLLVLDAMLPELKKRGHKVLLFSQFVKMLEVLEEYCIYRNYNYNLLCGDTSLAKREEIIRYFNESEESFIFLISTRAGGLGINLAAADTVILYDTDWNPQGDLQAQDRCHRIGQNRPVVVYRLIIPNTIDERMFQRAQAKRKLEKVIIKTGRFNSKNNKVNDQLTIEELLELLQSDDSSGFVKTDDNCVFSTEELNRILDRSDMIESA